MKLPVLIVWLVAAWALLWADFGVANLIAGTAVALFVVALTRPAGTHALQHTSLHPLWAVVYLVYFVYQLTTANLQVAWEIITPGSRVNRAIIAVPMHVRTPGLITLIGNSITLTPGTLTVDVDKGDPGSETPPTLYIHVLHFDDVDSVRTSVLNWERLAVKAFGSRQQRAMMAEVTGVDR